MMSPTSQHRFYDDECERALIDDTEIITDERQSAVPHVPTR